MKRTQSKVFESSPELADDLCSEAPVLRQGLSDSIEEVMNRIGLSLKGREYVRSCILAPSRRVRTGICNVAGWFPSVKVGLSIGFEARTTELSEILRAEADDNTIAFFDQAQYIKIAFKNGRGRNSAYQQRPDFLRIYNNKITLRECKTVAELLARSKKDPLLFSRGTDGKWHCPPAELAAAEFGFSYELVTEEDLNPVFTRNLRLLLQYSAAGDFFVKDAAMQTIVATLERSKGIRLDDLCEQVKESATIDDIHRAIALNRVCANLEDEWLGDREHAFLFLNQAVMSAFKASRLGAATASPWMRVTTLELKAGTQVVWDGKHWQLANLGASDVVLLDGLVVQTLPRAIFEQFVQEGRIGAAGNASLSAGSRRAEGYQILKETSSSEVQKALSNRAKIQDHLNGTARYPANRTQRRLLAKWRAAEAALGNGFLGLLSHFSKCGNRIPRLESQVLDLVSEQVKTFYANPKRMKRIRVYERIAHHCKENGYQVPSYGWFCGYLKRLPAYELALARNGRRAAYKAESRAEPNANVATHRADRAFGKVYIDHTETDVEIKCSRTSKSLGRPWLVTMIDDHSGDCLAYYLSFEPPSYRAVLMVLRDCVRRHGRLPECMVVDGAKEFQSIWFEATAAFLRMEIQRRPAAKARFGARGERTFHTINTNFLHTLLGNTQVRRDVRQITPEVDPNNLAVWTLAALNNAFEKYFENYRNLVHREILVTPLEARLKSMERMGDLPERRITYDLDFLICTCPTTKKGCATVQSDGVKINYLYYSAPELRMSFGKSIPVRYEPFNAGIAYAMLNGRWVELRSRFYAELKGRTERELIIAREEFNKRRRDVEKLRLTESGLVKFLLELDKEEEMLIAHHRAIETRRLQSALPDTTDWKSEDERESSPIEEVLEPRPSEGKSSDYFAMSQSDYIALEVK